MARIRSIKPELWDRSNAVWSHGHSIYVVHEEGGPIKLGVARHPIRRLSILQCGNPRRLTLVAAYAATRTDCLYIEKLLLKRFASVRVRGEWLGLRPDEILEVLEGLCA